MKTRKEQIDEMANIIKADYKQWLDITGVFPEGSSYYFECLGGGEDCAELLYNAGYGDVSEYEAERKMLGSKIKVLEQCLNNKYIEVDNLNRDYRNAFERLKAQEREIERLKAEVKQAKIDVLNELKDKMFDREYMGVKYKERIFYGSEIDNMIAEVQNGEDKG